ncbi:MAG: HEAT repeat domain-containing protein [Myxococcales bacterium]|nr:HEAT repeat domain-containing protein [Myxococcales bacterium]
MKSNMKSKLAAALVLGLGLTAAQSQAEPTVQSTQAGRSTVYKDLSPSSLEDLSSPERIIAVTRGSSGASEIYGVLEQGEKVECMQCVPYVAELLTDKNPRTREISAWWLRRRVFGVFGKGEVYSQVVDRLQDSSQPALQRAYAAEALGEFLTQSSVKFVAKSAMEDPDAIVRVASVKALQRLNTQGPNGEVGAAMADPDEEVRMTALRASTHINVFTDVEMVVERIDDESARVRTRAAETLGAMRATDAVVGLIALAQSDSDANVRKAAVAALGNIGDQSARPAVEAALKDSDSLVRDAAKIALRSL